MFSRNPGSASGVNDRPAVVAASTRPPRPGFVGTSWARATFAEATPRARDNAPAAQALDSLDILPNMTDSFVAGAWVASPANVWYPPATVTDAGGFGCGAAGVVAGLIHPAT